MENRSITTKPSYIWLWVWLWHWKATTLKPKKLRYIREWSSYRVIKKERFPNVSWSLAVGVRWEIPILGNLAWYQQWGTVQCKEFIGLTSWAQRERGKKQIRRKYMWYRSCNTKMNDFQLLSILSGWKSPKFSTWLSHKEENKRKPNWWQKQNAEKKNVWKEIVSDCRWILDKTWGVFTLLTLRFLKSRHFDPTIYTWAKKSWSFSFTKLRDFLVGSAHVRSQATVHAFMHAAHAVCMRAEDIPTEVPKVTWWKVATFLRLPFTLANFAWNFATFQKNRTPACDFSGDVSRVFMRCC